MHRDIEEVLFTEDAIRARIAELGAAITEAYRGDDLVLMALLKGGVIMLGDLMRRIPIPLEIELVKASSYGAGTVSSGRVEIEVFPEASFKGKRLLVLDDILDTGRTLKAVVDRLKARGAEDVRTCVLLDKKARRAEGFEADWSGFPVDDRFVVGYGLDHAGRYRNLPYIGVLKPKRHADDT